MRKKRKMQQLLKLRNEYDELLTERMLDLNRRQPFLKMSTAKFMVKERDLNRKISDLKQSLGILARAEAIICGECGESFQYHLILDGATAVLIRCWNHVRREPLKHNRE